MTQPLASLLASLLFAGASIAGWAAVPTPTSAPADQASSAAFRDPPRDAEHPANNRSLRIPSHGSEMNAVFLLAAGSGPKPTLLLLHGLPGHERNLDVAQAARRAGWNVLAFTYRGAWGSPGNFSIAHAIEDASAALAFVRAPETARQFEVDSSRIVIGGHSMGGFAAALAAAAAQDGDLVGLVLIDAWNAGATATEINAGGPAARAALIASVDLGHSLHGATPDSLADELLGSTGWNLLDRAKHFADVPVLTIYASDGFAAANRALATAIRDQRGKVTAVEMQTGHDFADHRLALAATIVDWLGPIASQKDPRTR